MMQKVYVVQLAEARNGRYFEASCKTRCKPKEGTTSFGAEANQSENSSQGRSSRRALRPTPMRRVAEALDVSPKTVFNIRRKVGRVGTGARPLNVDLNIRPSSQPKLDGKAEAKLDRLQLWATTGRPTVNGRCVCWPIKAVELELVDSISREDNTANAKKNVVKPWLTQSWCLPKEHDAEFVWRMEDVLDVYARPYDRSFSGDLHG